MHVLYRAPSCPSRRAPAAPACLPALCCRTHPAHMHVCTNICAPASCRWRREHGMATRVQAAPRHCMARTTCSIFIALQLSGAFREHGPEPADCGAWALPSPQPAALGERRPVHGLRLATGHSPPWPKTRLQHDLGSVGRAVAAADAVPLQPRLRRSGDRRGALRCGWARPLAPSGPAPRGAQQQLLARPQQAGPQQRQQEGCSERVRQHHHRHPQLRPWSAVFRRLHVVPSWHAGAAAVAALFGSLHCEGPSN